MKKVFSTIGFYLFLIFVFFVNLIPEFLIKYFIWFVYFILYKIFEYRKKVVANNDWNAQPIASSPIKNGVVPPVATGSFSATVTSCCGVLFLKDMVQGASPLGWLVRYRNRYTGCATAYLVTDPLWSTDTWVLGSYTTEYWPY